MRATFSVSLDLDELAGLGATHVLLDTYRGTPDRMRPTEEDHRTLDVLLARFRGR